MREVFKKIKNYYIQKKRIAVAATVAVLGMAAAVGVYAMIPDINADTPETLRPGKSMVEQGKSYVITGDSSESYTLTYSGDGNSPVYITLDNAHFSLGSDIPAIEFTGQGAEDSSSYSANFVVTIKGKNTITSSCIGAKNPLIKVEDMSYEVKAYNKDSNYTKYEDRFEKYTVSRNCSVRFTGTGSASDSLTLETAQGSFGAAIGSSEIEAMGEGIKFQAGKGSYLVILDGQQVYVKHGQESFTGSLKCGNGNIEIASGANIFIEGNGYGAGIGTGASVNETIRFKGDSNLNTTNIQTANAFSVMDGSGISVSGGSLAIHMNGSGGYCMGTGAVAGEGNSGDMTGVVTITGGTLDLSPFTDGYEFVQAVNAKGANLYKFIFSVDEAMGSSGVVSAGEPYALTDTVGGERVYYVTHTGNDAAISDSFNLTVDDSSAYSFKGYASEYFNYTGGHQMYFYLPTEILPTHALTVDGDFAGAGYQYKQGNNKYSVIESGHPVNAKETKEISVKLSDVPKYCTKLSYRTSTGDEGVIKKDVNDEYIYTFIMPGDDFSVYFSYEIGRYSISYACGSDSQEITNPNVSTYACGEIYTLQDPAWSGHTFEGWYSDEACTNKITEVTSDVVDDVITVYAKWVCTVSFVDDEGNIIYETTLDYGTRFKEENYPEDPGDTAYKAFEGWLLNGTAYDKGSHPEFVVTMDIVITGRYSPVGFYVNINATYTNEDGHTSIADIKRMAVFEMYFKGEAIAFKDIPSEEDLYYTTVNFADRSDITTGKITGRNGYKISSIDVKDADGNNLELFSTIDDDHAFTFVMPDKDVYITVNFQTPDYTISYYDYDEVTQRFEMVTPVETEDNPNRFEFNANTETFSLNPAPQKDKYRQFAGWYVFGTSEETVVDTVPTGAYSKDIILVATWKDVVTYPVEVSEECAEYIKVYDSDGKEVSKGIPGERLSIVVMPGTGIQYESMTYSYTDEDGGVYTNRKTPSGDEKYPCTYYFKMPEYKVDVTGEFSLIEYKITYLNLDGAENNNPVTYTVKSVFDLEDLEKKGRVFEGWKIILPDPEKGYSAVREEPISRIENMTGNLILVAEWDTEEEYGSFFRVTVDDAVSNGNMTVYAEEAYEGQYVFISVTPERGYRLKSISYDDAEPVIYSAVKALRATGNLFNVKIDVPLYEVAEGVYYFIMPDKDVKLMAEFEPIEYSITYIDGNSEKNPENYTVESEIELAAPEKEGYEFLGWFDEEGKQVSFIKDTIGNLTLTAKWNKLPDGDDSNHNQEPDDDDIEETPSDANQQPDSKDDHSSLDSEIPSKLHPYSDILDQLLSVINDKSKVTSSEDTSAQENQSKGNITQQLSTGDKANISHFVLLCILSLIVIVIVCPKKKDEELQ